ncbi:protein DMP3-like [Corylus avellana]|uniref:protein DMP3-like n=1 Tax=Corylus avellana TaxID=13451 RepID=UPI001E1FAF29|nr:protein DMP3-like [Corylus avellana]
MAEPSPTQPPPNCGSDHPVHKTLASVANLANLLPTGSVLAFQALTPSFSNNGSCQLPNDFTDKQDGKLYYGIATFNGFYIFNYNYGDQDVKELDKFKLSLVDFVHAFVSPLVFMVFAATNSNLQSCFFPEAGANENAVMMNLPLGAGLFSSFLFILFPTRRRGIGI